jgi:predicted transcriptional regulator
MIKLTAEIVATYLAHNSSPASEIPDLIRSTYAALIATAAQEVAAPERGQPAVSVKKSVTSEALYCLECGKPQKMLKRHISTAHGLSVADYRTKWGLASDYPMVAPDYAAHRSILAKKIGLGHKRKAAPTPTSVVAEKPKRGRPRKAVAQ